MPKSHIAFKCAYNDGGKSINVGYQGVCSPNSVIFNIQKRKVPWCSQESECSDYLANNFKGGVSSVPCMESCLFKDWIYGTGKYLAEPNRMVKSVAVLTTRFPEEDKEEKRKVIGFFVMDEVKEDDVFDYPQHIVSSQTSKFRLALPRAIAQKVNLWDYYSIDGKPSWGTGLYRYLTKKMVCEMLLYVSKQLGKYPDLRSVADNIRNGL